MILLLTILSVLAVWAFLTVLVVGLFLIFKPLESIRINLGQIAMGVRAIEQETKPLRERTAALAGNLSRAGVALDQAAGKLVEVNSDLEAAAPSLLPPARR